MRENVKRAKKLNDKGFSLIELIIVIAIMAILIGIVGMQFMPYIEKSRQAKDKQVLSAVLTDATSAFATCADSCDLPADKTTQSFNITVGCDGGFSSSDISLDASAFSGAADLKAALAELMGSSTKKLESKEGKKINTITISRDSAGQITVSVAGKDDNPVKSGTFKNMSSN